jgi:cell division transport system ATP-binding protein
MNSTPPPADTMLQFDGVGWRDGANWRLRGARFSVARGACLLLDGAPTAGTAALRLAARLATPQEGTITLAGHALANVRQRALPALRRSLGVLLDDPGLLDDRSLEANVALAAQAAGVAADEARNRAAVALERVGVATSVASQRPVDTSHADRRLTLLARALVNHPALLLLDAPTRGLPPHRALAVIDLLDACRASGVAVAVADPGDGWDSGLPRVTLTAEAT